MNIPWLKAALLSLAIASATAGLCQRPGDLVITPTRILLDDKGRSADITLVNRGLQTTRYRLTLVDMEMSEDGQLKRVQNTPDSAIGVLKLSPREIVLEPGVSQRIKIAAFFPKEMADRELRSHLAFEPIATPQPLVPQGGGSQLRLSIEMRTVVTIPVIARHGRLAAEATISDAGVVRDDAGSAARFKLSRTGSRSVRGDVNVAFVPSDGGSRIQLGQIAGLPVYCPNADRIVTVRLNRDIRSLGKGEIVISFAEERSRGAATARSVVELTG